MVKGTKCIRERTKESKGRMEEGSKAWHKRRVVFEFEIGSEMNDDGMMSLDASDGFGDGLMGFVFAKESNGRVRVWYN